MALVTAATTVYYLFFKGSDSEGDISAEKPITANPRPQLSERQKKKTCQCTCHY